MKYVNLRNIVNNLNEIKRVSNGKNIYAVLKANAYGHGLKRIFELLVSEHINYFCVSNINDALYLRSLNKSVNILLLSDFSLNDIEILKNNDITVTISKKEKISFLDNMKIELKVNTGMNRYGINPDDFYECLDLISKKNLKLIGIYTHIGDYGSATFYDQYLKFYNLVKKIDKINIHLQSSNGLEMDMDFFNSVRVGMALYRDNSMKIEEKISNIVYAKENEVVGYNDYKMTKDGYLGVINIGYSDGLLRANKGRYVYIKNNFYKIVSVCMNHTIVLVDESIKEGSKVTLLGEEVKIEYIKDYLKTNAYEVLVSFPNQGIIYVENW